jgi:glycosyltransferase involved in cell wall biosynthesis
MFDPIPEISIILPTYNRAKHLPKAIESVINQTYEDWELIIIDDGSKDDTFAAINPYLDSLRIRYIKHKNRKAGYARNAGIQASYGQYITFIDSDDIYFPNHLQTRIDYMKSHPELDLIYGGYQTDTDEDIWVVDYFNQDRLVNLKECVTNTFFGKREVFFELQGFNNFVYGEDTDFWLRAEQTFKTAKILEPKTYLYTTRAETSVTKDRLKQLQSTS